MTVSFEVTLKDQTIQDLLRLSETEFVSNLSPEVLANAARRDADALAKFTDVTRLSVVNKDLASHVLGFLQGNALEIFVGAWARVFEVVKAAKESSRHPAETFPVILAEHEFSWSVEPVIEICLDGAVLGKIPFAISLDCKVESVELILRAGKLQRIVSGTCALKATITCGGEEIVKRPLATVNLPGDFRPTQGLQLIGVDDSPSIESDDERKAHNPVK